MGMLPNEGIINLHKWSGRVKLQITIANEFRQIKQAIRKLYTTN